MTSNHEFERLALRFQSTGSDADWRRLWSAYGHIAARIVRSLTPWAKHEACRDMWMSAQIGLMKAARRYQAGRGIAFCAYANRLVAGELLHFRRDYLYKGGDHIGRYQRGPMLVELAAMPERRHPGYNPEEALCCLLSP